MLKTQIGLGVLSIPSVFHSLGLIPGVIIILVIAAMTSWSNYIIGVFKMNHPDIYGIDDVGRKLFGRFGYEFFGITFALYWIFVAGSGMLGISTALNALSSHGACTAIFVAVAAIAGFGLGSIQTLGKISWLAWIGVVSILSSSKFSKLFTTHLSVVSDDLRSSDLDGCCRTSRPSRRCASDWPLQV
jgi:amino acid permease